MPTTITMPQLGESVHEGTVARWLKAVGDRVERFENLLEVNTDKVSTEVPSTTAGVLVEILVQEGDTVAVGTPIAVVDEAAVAGAPTAGGSAPQIAAVSTVGGQAEATVQPPPAPRPPTSVENAEPASEIGAEVSGEPGRQPVAAPAAPAPTPAREREYAPIGTPARQAKPAGGAEAAPNGRDDGRRYSPAVRRLAREHNIDLSLIKGTGLGGRVTRDDVLAFLEEMPAAPSPAHAPARAAAVPAAQAPAARPPAAAPPVTSPTAAPPPARQAAPAPAPAAAAAAPAPAVAPAPLAASAAPAAGGLPAPAVAEGDERVPLSPMRRSIAEHMVRSKATSPHAHTVMEVDMHAVYEYRRQVLEEFRRREGFELTYLPFVIKAVVEALKRYPTLNAVWGGDSIIVKREVNIGVAVAIEPDGLVVPVIRNADSLSITGLARAVRDLATRARSNRLTLQDVQGGTFTVNNPGTFGTLISTPIINQPQAAIFSMEGIHKRPVVINDMIAIRPMMNAILAIDHRINDGMTAARFLAAVRDWLQQYQPGQAM